MNTPEQKAQLLKIGRQAEVAVPLPGGAEAPPVHGVRLASLIEVPPEGSPAARLWIVGEAPGETEVRQGRPFTGMAGGVLDGMLQEAGIARRECRIDNIVRFRPHLNKFGEFYRKDGTAKPLLEWSIKRLQDLIEKHRPHMILALGWEPLRLLAAETLTDGIKMWRGSVIHGPAGKLMGTFHPSYLLRQWADRPVAVADIRKAKTESFTPGLVRKVRKNTVNWGFNATRDALRDMLEHASFVSFDIETDTKAEITSIALADAPEFAVVVPIAFRGRRHWTSEEERILKGFVKQILESQKIQKIAQNAQYDMIWLKAKWGVEVAPLFMDTLVAHNLLVPECPKSLAFQCSIYTDIPYYKFQSRTDDPDTYFRYNAQDAMATFECAQEIQAALEEDKLWDFYCKLPHALLAPLRELSLRGVRIDLALRNEMTRELEEERKTLTAAIREDATIREFEEKYLGARQQEKAAEKCKVAWEKSKEKCEKAGKWPKSAISVKYPKVEDYVAVKTEKQPEVAFNPDSPQQVAAYLYTFRKFKAQLKRRADGTRTITADSAAIKKINTKLQEPLLQALLDHADVTKQLEFLNAKLEPDERMHCTYDITGTETGRISSKKYVTDTGANLQNQPAGKKKESTLRRIFIPDEGKVFLQRDLKQAEAWIVAFLSEDPFFMDAIRSSDIHRRTASLIFRKPECEVTKRERDLAKRCVHALNYGMGYVKFAEQLGISIVEARDLRNRYFAAFPKLQVWHSETKLKLAKTRRLTTPFGRVREFSAGWNEDLWKAAWAYIPQSTVGDLLNTGFLEFWRWLKVDGNEERFDCQVMLQIHDSLVVQCPEEHVPVIAKKLKECLERPITVNGHIFTIPTDCAVGPNWLDLKERKDLE